VSVVTSGPSELERIRREYHRKLGESIVRWTRRENRSFPSFADGTSNSSVAIAVALSEALNFTQTEGQIGGQTAGRLFEQLTCEFIQQAVALLEHLHPGRWVYRVEQTTLSDYVQYRHLARLKSLVERDIDLKGLVGLEYIVTPDIVIGRHPVSDGEINERTIVVTGRGINCAGLTPFREVNQKDIVLPLLHAVVSCKWTIRSDRSQNIRTEALSLIRLRKGSTPRIVAVTAEPLPTRLASLALGTGDLDCVYHIALGELRHACLQLDLEDQTEMLETLIKGDRLRDIGDLPFDLVA